MFVERTLNETSSVQNKIDQQRDKILSRFKPLCNETSKLKVEVNSMTMNTNN